VRKFTSSVDSAVSPKVWVIDATWFYGRHAEIFEAQLAEGPALREWFFMLKHKVATFFRKLVWPLKFVQWSTLKRWLPNLKKA